MRRRAGSAIAFEQKRAICSSYELTHEFEHRSRHGVGMGVVIEPVGFGAAGDMALRDPLGRVRRELGRRVASGIARALAYTLVMSSSSSAEVRSRISVTNCASVCSAPGHSNIAAMGSSASGTGSDSCVRLTLATTASTAS